eukprot:365209-Chlamydomonas_euryale.AAC.11
MAFRTTWLRGRSLAPSFCTTSMATRQKLCLLAAGVSGSRIPVGCRGQCRGPPAACSQQAHDARRTDEHPMSHAKTVCHGGRRMDDENSRAQDGHSSTHKCDQC